MSQVASMVQGNLLPILDDTLYDDDGSTLDLTTATSVELQLRRRGSSTVTTLTASFTADTTGYVSYAWVTGDTDTAGDYIFTWLVTFTGGKPRTFPSGTPSGPTFGTLRINHNIANASL